MKNYQQVNSFNQKPSIAQIVSYILFLTQLLTFYIIIQNRLPQEAFIPLHVVYAICWVGQLISTLISSLIDPVDDMVVKTRNGEKLNDQQSANYLYCGLCQSYVKNKTKHCRVCGRCVEMFDHHCIWINNCIGSKNYRSFIVMILLTFFSMTVFIVSIVVVWVDGLYHSNLSEMIALWIIGFLIGVFGILILNLILLHLYLNCKGMSTIELIMQEKEAEKLQELEERKKTRKQKEQISEFEVNQVGVREDDHKTEGNILSKPINHIFVEADNKSDKKIKLEQECKSKSSSSSLNNFFTNNKSLKILVKSEIVKPQLLNTSSLPPQKMKGHWGRSVPIKSHF